MASQHSLHLALLLLLCLMGCPPPLQITDGGAIDIGRNDPPPVARITGPERRDVQIGFVVALDGSLSDDAGGQTILFDWSVVGQPPGSGCDAGESPDNDESFEVSLPCPGTYLVQLVVWDSGGQPSNPAVVELQAAERYFAGAGPDREVDLGEVVQLDASASVLPEGAEIAYSWQLLEAPATSSVVIASDNLAQASFVAEDPHASYQVALVITVDHINQLEDAVTIDVRNTAPVASCGGEVGLLPSSTLQLDGSGSRDSDGDALSFAWSLLGDALGSTLGDSGSERPTLQSGDRTGSFEIKLTVTDPGPTSAEASCMVRVVGSAIAELEAVALTTGSIVLSWQDLTSLESGFRLERLDPGGGDYTLVEEALPPGTEEYTDVGLQQDTSYGYRLTAFGPDGDLGQIVAIGWTRPPAPVGLVAGATSTTTVRLGWDPYSSPNVTALRLERSPAGQHLFTEVATLDTSSVEQSDGGLVEGTSYNYRLFATNPGSESVPAEATIRTAFGPQLSWSGDPVLGADCRLSLPGQAELDAASGANFASASADFSCCVDDSVADRNGISGLLNGAPEGGELTATWRVEDSLGETRELEATVGFTEVVPTIYTTEPAIPTLELGNDGMAGRQVWFKQNEPDLPADACPGCTGQRASIALGRYHVCVLVEEGRVKCWGGNEFGQLGDGTTTQRFYPTYVCAEGTTEDDCGGGQYLEGVVALAASDSISCALLEDSTLRCWGYNGAGQLGDGTTESRLLPTPVCEEGSTDDGCAGGQHLQNVRAVSCGGQSACAILANGTARCWGENNDGQLGDGTTESRLLPTPVCAAGSTDDNCADEQFLNGLASIVSGGTSTCAIRSSDGGVLCWGENDSGQQGDGTTENRLLPFSVCMTGSIADGCSGGDVLTQVIQIAVGRTTCALQGDHVYCWGDDEKQQLGDGTAVPQDCNGHSCQRIPVPVCLTGNGPVCADGAQLFDVVAISGTGFTICAILSSSDVICWGGNYFGSIGNGVLGNFTSECDATNCFANPVPVCVGGSGESCSNLTGAISIVNHEFNSCTATEDFRVHCWGDNTAGQTGRGGPVGIQCRADPLTICNPNAAAVCDERDTGDCSFIAESRSCAQLDLE